MAKSWADMSKLERARAGGNKKAYNKSTGQERYALGGELERKAAPRPAPAPKPGPIMNGGQDDVFNPNRSKAKERTQVFASTSPNAAALNNEHTPKANDVGSGSKPAAAATPQRDILKTYDDGRIHYADGVITSDRAKYDQMEADRQQKAQARGPAPMTAQQQRAKSNEAYRQSRLDMRAAKDAAGGGANTFAVDDTGHYAQQMKDKGYYHSNQSKNEIIKGLMGTGQKFGSLDIEREMGSNSTHSLDGLFKHYGGIENYQQNHSVGSGNFQSRYSPDEYMTGEQAQGIRDQKDAAMGDWLQGEGADKYGEYDWFQKQQAQYDTRY